MLSFILIVLVIPYCVFILAVRFSLRCLAILQCFPFSPFLWSTYSIAFSHALSYALVTSRNILWIGFLDILPWLMNDFNMFIWSVVDLPC